MTSVWKRLQRVGKKASKFQFTASYQSLTVECVRGGKWQPNKLVVVWTRRKRRKLTKPMSWQPGISNPFRGIIVWPEPEPVDITVTLYKDSKPGSQFEDKEWTFVIEDESPNGRRKPIATGTLNMADYHSVESRTFDVTLTMKVANKKLVSASLEFNLSCVLIKEGMATDDDMISIGSMMSLNDNYYLDDNDDDMEVAPSPRVRHKRNLSQGNAKVPVVIKLQDSEDGKRESPTASPVPSKKRNRIRSKSALGDNTKTLISDLQKEEGMKRLSTGSDVSAEISDSGQEVTKDKSKMESELIKWARSCTKGHHGVKVKNMTTCWRDGLAFCAILHNFHPDKIDFASLDPHNIKENNKSAFSAFEKLGIPRLLDPTQMMFSPVPDKLSVMTYVFQIKTHFSRPPAPPPSPLHSLATSHTPRRLPVPPQVTITSNEEPKGRDDDVRVADTDNRGVRKETAAEGSEEGCNPFLDDDEEGNDADSTPEISTDPSATSSGDSKQSKSSKQEAVTNSSSTSVESKSSIQESSSKRNDVLVKSDLKPPPKPPRLYQTTSGSPSVDTDSKTSDTAKDKTESKPGYNPFDEDETEQAVVSKKTDPSSKSAKPNKAYNPFDDDEGDIADDDAEEKNLNDKDTKQGYNPFDNDDDDDSEDVTQTKNAVDQNAGKKSSGAIKRQVSYPHSFNPFEDNEDLKSNNTDKSSQRTESKDNKVDKDTKSAKSSNPFDDDNDDEGVRNDGGAVDTSQAVSSTRKSSLESKEKVKKVALQSGRASPSGLAKPAETHAKKRRAPPPPAVRSSDDPWTARLPDDATPRRRRVSRPTTPGTSEQTSPHTSPAKSGPNRAAPAPPRRPPLIPTFDEWRSGAPTDRGATGDNDRPAASSSAEGSPSRKTSSDKGDTGSRSPVTGNKASSTDGANQADIKLLARQVLMDARKKAGASGALPRERVAEITKTTKGPTADKATSGSINSEDGAQDKEKVDDQEALKKKENLRLRKEELQRRKKAGEKAQKMVQNAIAKEKAQQLTSSPEQTRTERKTQDSGTDVTDAASNDQKPVGNKNLQHRPLKLKEKENDSHKRKLSAGKDAKSPPDKAGFKESEELQRIRQILNQGKKEKKPSNSETVDQETDAVQAQSPETSQEGKRKMSDSKSSKYTAVNGVKGSPTPTPPPRPKVRGPNAGLHAYVESRKMNFEVFEVPPVRTQQTDEQSNAETGKDVQDVDTTDGQTKNEDSMIDNEDHESEDQTREFQDTSEYVRRELKSIEEQQEALDKVGEKLEIELRRAMECKGCEEEQEKLMQDWFVLVNKKNELVRRQGELNLLKNEEDLERSHDMLQRELRALLEMEDWKKTEEQREREMELIEQLVSVVNKRDQLVQFEDSQLQQAEKDALHVQKVIDNVRISKDRNECVLQ